MPRTILNAFMVAVAGKVLASKSREKKDEAKK